MGVEPVSTRTPRKPDVCRKLARGLSLAAALSVLFASAALGLVRLSSGFGSGGIASTGTGAVMGVAVQKDGRVIAVGYSGRSMLVERLGTNGSRQGRFSAGRGVANAVVVQPDGKIVVAGTTAPVSQLPGDEYSTAQNGDMVLERFNPNGSRDRSFGSGGTAHVRGAIAYALALGPNGTIVAAGFVRGVDTTPRVAIARFLKTGKPDRSFGTRGFAEIDLGRFSEAYGVAVQRSGKIVFAGDQRPDLRITNGLIGRVTSRGTLDRSFSHGGVYFYFHPQGGAASSFKSLALDSRGRVIGGGGDSENSGQHALVVRLSANGAPDRGFGSGGVLTTPAEEDFTGGTLIAGVYGVIATGGGKITAVGRYMFGGLGEAAVWQITSGGRVQSLVRTRLPATLGGQLTSIAPGKGGSFYAGGYQQPFNALPTAFVAKYLPG